MAPQKKSIMTAIAVVIIMVAAQYPATIQSFGLLLFGRHRRGAMGRQSALPAPFYQHRQLFGLSSPFIGARSDSRYDFSVIIVSYHKTGHDLQMDLVDFITGQFPGAGPQLTRFGNKSPLKRRRHPPITPCARIHLQTGTIMVQHAPDLFCTPEELAHMLLEGGDDHQKRERGIKIIHLVRNPFNMAVSNYHYHAQIPTPEPWVRSQNPCDIQHMEKHKGELINETFSDMVLPTLSKMKYESLGVSFGEKLVTRAEFDGVLGDCLSLYQTKPGLENANFLDHLMNYDPPEGLRLATAELMIQGHDNGGDILRMANNIVKFKQVQKYVQKSNEENPTEGRKKEVQVYTMSLDDFIANPSISALKFFDFVLPSNVPRKRKEEVALKYEQYYQEKKKQPKQSRHITDGKSENSVQLKEYLRHNPTFGPPLSKMALLVEAALVDSRNM